ncbi:uncharacterized protein UV8b_05144 [Ustilaginoidea virens]|uniref:RING-type E3 ubiquitin transferase n=1 Tax=Ustilaginoidea virens TaxID=1159556 RepID=A0A063CCJ8_USTVR|nr:uncharacterized protein UV8b_05144 [Ustilaginoidea virens]QUC20903.1 hypothetical protein UV8b_05144 [Ustilaginoidea virens]GAO19207.1 hypothetical protein UVI_02008000 [Ustilaginoidea virens]
MAPAQDQDQDQDCGDLRRTTVFGLTLDQAATTDDAQDCCVVCLDAITDPCEARPCGHRNFDYICLVSWLFENPQCPLCKAPVVKVTHGPAQAPTTTFFKQKPAPKTAAPASASSAAGVRAHRVRPYGNRASLGCPRQRPGPSRHAGGSTATAASQAIATRRGVYRNRLFSKHVGSNRLSRYRELTPQMFLADADLVSRARMWTRRELRVFSFLAADSDADGDGDADRDGASGLGSGATARRRRANNAEFLLEYVIAILKSVDIMGSRGQAEDMLSDFLGAENANIFLHELRAWLRSPYTKLEDWDRAVQYDAVSEGSTRGAEASGQGVGASTAPGLAGRGERGGRKGDFYRPRCARRPTRTRDGSTVWSVGR